MVSSLASPSHREPRRAAATSPSPIGVCGPSQCPPPWRGARGHARHCIGTRRPNIHWHTPHPSPTPLRAWGAQRGDCERVCGRASPPITTEHRPHFPGHPKHTPSQSPSCYSSRKLSVRARGSHRCPLRFGTSRSRSNRTRLRAFDARRSALACIAARLPACSAARGVRGRGGTGRCRATLAQHASVHASPAPRPHNPRGRSGLMVDDWV